MTKKLGPLPLWAWGLILGVGGYFLYERYVSSSSSSTSTVSPETLDPNSVDPNTGLTYAQEEEDALAAQSNSDALTGTSSAPTESDLQTGTSELGDLSSFLTQFGSIANDLGYTQPGTNGTSSSSGTSSSVPPANTSPTTQAAASSPPVQNTSPPTVSASAHSAKPGPTTGTTPSVLSQLATLLNSGYKKVTGTTQKGSSYQQTGTYVAKGKPTVYIYQGSPTSGLSIRQAKAK